MANEHFPHVVLRDISQTEKFSRPGTGGKRRFPSQVRDREAHAIGLLQQLNASEEAARGAVAQRSELLTQAENGIYLAFEGRHDEPLLTERFERRGKGIELLSVREEAGRTTATVFVPESAKEVFPKVIEDYRTKDEPRAKEPEPMNRRLVDGIAEIRLAALRDLWIDIPDRFPASGETADWEVWLRPAATERFRQAAREVGAVVGSSSLVFPEEIALFAQTSPEILAQLNESTLGLARVARARRTAAFFLNTKPADQMRQMQEFLSRVRLQDNPRTSLCILDTGVNRAHLLLAPLIAAEDCHSYLEDWSTDDRRGHGTAMSGVCGYGDLACAMNGQDHMSVPYALESVKIIPPVGRNPYELYGAITAGAVAKAELAKPHRKRVFCLAITTDEDTPHFGRPTSWSAEVDQLSFGSLVVQREARLLCISAGNIRDQQLRRIDYPEFNDLQELESPAHAWNGLAVGACTAMTRITDPTRAGWTPFSVAGDLGPVSRTAAWNDTWPIKPDIVMEGGNLGVDPANGLGYGIDELRLLTTSKDYPQTPFEAFGDTSAATANAARLCAIVQSQYPDLWPETIRSLVIGSAEWTDAMLNHLPANPKKSDHAILLKRYGYGVPDLDRALYSASNSLTLVVEDTIQPYSRNEKKRVALNEMKLFKLPWPLQALTSLGNTEVRMRVTLSYFIEPNPAESARNRKLRYASHGLRFAVKLPDEEFDAFRKRVNKAAREDVGVEHHESDSFWILGANLRDRGSVHSDIWRGPASDLARRGFIAVYPVSGWWKDREHLERYNRAARFSLVVGIVTPPTKVDIYSPIMNRITIQA